jgi:transcriptional regulator with XRE-family HTH domain
MPSSGSPMVRRRRLAGELRRLRASTGKTADDVAKILGWSKAKVSRYELAHGGLKLADVARLLEFYGVQGSHREQLLALAEEATHKGWWEAYSDVLPEGHLAYIGLEAEATSILEWQINVVPGLLQSEQYAREILSGYHDVATISPRAIQRRLETRITRQQLLTRDKPLEYVALLDESVLHRQRGDPSVMNAQLQRLAEVSELPNVTIQIVPLKANRGLAVDSFSILQFGKAHETTFHDMVSLEHLVNELYVEGDTDTYQFRLAFDRLASEALSPQESRDLILTTHLGWRRAITRPTNRTLAPPVGGEVCALFAADIAEFTRPDRDDDIRMFIREELYRILERAFDESEIPWTACFREDRGDGALVVVPPNIAPKGIIDPLPERIRSLIRRHNHVSSTAAHIQLRAAVHLGPVHHDGHGFVGADVDFLFRMLDARLLKHTLASTGADLALIISDYVYRNIVSRHPSLVSPAAFQPVRFQVKRTKARAWTCFLSAPSL